MGHDLTKEELWQIKRLNQRAKSIGGKVEVIWNKSGLIDKIYVSGEVGAKEVYHPNGSLDHPKDKNKLDGID